MKKEGVKTLLQILASIITAILTTLANENSTMWSGCSEFPNNYFFVQLIVFEYVWSAVFRPKETKHVQRHKNLLKCLLY